MSEIITGDVLSAKQVSEYNNILADYLIDEPTLAEQIYGFLAEGQTSRQVRARLDQQGVGASAANLKRSTAQFEQTFGEG